MSTETTTTLMVYNTSITELIKIESQNIRINKTASRLDNLM